MTRKILGESQSRGWVKSGPLRTVLECGSGSQAAAKTRASGWVGLFSLPPWSPHCRAVLTLWLAALHLSLCPASRHFFYWFLVAALPSFQFTISYSTFSRFNSTYELLTEFLPSCTILSRFLFLTSNFGLLIFHQAHAENRLLASPLIGYSWICYSLLSQPAIVEGGAMW